MFGHGSQYGRKKEAAIAALLSERTLPDAAHVAGISTKTLRRWLKLPDFQRDLLAARRERYDQGTARIEQNIYQATTTLLMLMADPKIKDMVRFRATESVLDRGYQRIVLESIEQRLSELETARGLKKVVVISRLGRDLMTGSKIQQFQRRLDKLASLFPVKPPPSREDLIGEMAVGLVTGEQLWLVDRMLEAERLIPTNEQELQAVAAYNSAFERATQVIDSSSKEEIQRLIDKFGKLPTPPAI